VEEKIINEECVDATPFSLHDLEAETRTFDQVQDLEKELPFPL
jgi:hypothetical protein